MILIYTNKEDVHPTNIIRYLSSWGISVFRLNTECLLTDYEFNWWADARGTDFRIRNIKTNYTLSGHDITAIYDRRPQKPTELLLTSDNEEINRYNLMEANGFLNFLRYYTKNIFSIGSIVEDRPAASKMLQMQYAYQLGMFTPHTCFSNSHEQIRQFAQQHKYLSLKPIDADSVFLDDHAQKVFYTQRVSSQDLLRQPDLAFQQTACFIQEYIEKQYELRLIVVEDEVITCKIYSQEQSVSQTDWRLGSDNLHLEIIPTPEPLQTFCLKFLQLMHLRFGCFDFICTPAGEYVFLECNPNGQWLWIEIQTGYDISHILAHHLAKYE